MVYIVAGLFAIFCIGVMIYVVKVYKEDKKIDLKVVTELMMTMTLCVIPDFYSKLFTTSITFSN
ncbi:MAG: hypothetical protein IPH34_14240 [Chitinophagaceae bacterium]|nr:hypothetical protein [Chitinophagaceae bacterium]